MLNVQCLLSSKWEFHVGYFHSNFHHLTYLLTPCTLFWVVTFSWRHTMSYTYDQLTADTFTWKTIGDTGIWHGRRFQFFSKVLSFLGLRSGWSRERGKRLKKVLVDLFSNFRWFGTKNHVRNKHFFLNVIFLLKPWIGFILNSIFITYMLHNSYGVFWFVLRKCRLHFLSLASDNWRFLLLPDGILKLPLFNWFIAFSYFARSN